MSNKKIPTNDKNVSNNEDYTKNEKKDTEDNDEINDDEDINSDEDDEFNYDDEGDVDADVDGEGDVDADVDVDVDADVDVDVDADVDVDIDIDVDVDIDDDMDDGDDDGNIIADGGDADVESMAVRVLDEDRITPNILTKYEMCRVLGIRTKQISEGAKPLINDSLGKSPIHIAINELMLNKMPFIIKRSMPYPKYELWKMADLKVNLPQDDIDDLINAVK